MFANALIVFRFGQNLIVLSVCKHKHRTLYSAQILLYYDIGRGVAKHSTQHLTQLFLCFFQCRQDENTLAGTQTIGLQNVWCLQCFKESDAFFNICSVESLIFCRWNIMAFHEAFCKVF